jgi:glutaredoxin 3
MTDAPVPVRVYFSHWCGYCARAKRLLESKGVEPELRDVDSQPGAREEMQELTGRRTVPQIFVGERHIGGCEELAALEQSGELDAILRRSA